MTLKNLFLGFIIFYINSFNAQCYYQLHMYDSYGDGWNGAFLEVTMNGVHVGDFDCDVSYTLDSVYSFTGATMDFIFHSGNWDSEITFAILSPIGDTLIYGPAPSDLDNLLHTSNSTCPSTVSCLNPFSLNASGLTTNSANLSWTPSATDTIWNLHWDTSHINSHPVNGVGNSINGLNSNNYSLTGLNPYTTYDFYVQAVCGANSNSIWSGPFTFTTLVIPGTCGAYLVELYDSYGDGWNGGYLEIILNGTIIDSNVTIQNGFGPESTPIPIDSGDILDVVYYPDQWPEENSYTIYDQSGNIIVNQTNIQPMNNGPMSTYGIQACVSCSSPISLYASAISTSNADLSWVSGGSGGNSWNLEWGISGFSPSSGTMINNLNSNSYSMTSLSPGTNYDFYVQEVCGANDVSSWSGPYTFTTNALTIPGSCGIFQIALLDSYGDGWNGGYLDIEVNYSITQTVTLQTGSGPEYFDISVDSGDVINVIYSPGNWQDENSYEIYNELGAMVASEAGSNGNGPADTYGLISCQSAGSGTINAPCGWFILETYDSLADGWDGSYISIDLNGISSHNLTMYSGSSTQIVPFMVDSNTIIDISYYENGANDQEQNGYKLMDNLGNTVAYELGSVNNGPLNTYGISVCQSTTSTEIINFNEVLIYPNPSNNLVNINSQELISKITITNILGEVVFERHPNQNIIAIDVSSFSSNLYTIKAMYGERQKVEKLLIQH